MNYCTHCRRPRMAGRYCGFCSEEYAMAPVLVADEDDGEEYDDEDYDPRPAAPAQKSGSGFMVGIVIALGLLLLVVWGNSKPQINELSQAYLDGKQVGIAYVESGEEIKPFTTAAQVCDVKAHQSGDPAADAEAETAAANREAGCRDAFDGVKTTGG